MLTPRQRSQYEEQGYVRLPNAGNGPRIILGKNIYSDSAVLNHG